MNDTDCTPAEIGLVRYIRSLDKRTIQAIHLWLFTGDKSLLIYEFTHRYLKAA